MRCRRRRYTGKAVHAMVGEMRERPEEWRGRKVLFVHTGERMGLVCVLRVGLLRMASLQAGQRC